MMKDKIRQILREETSGLSDAEKNVAYKMMNHITKGYYWYIDSPEQPFEWSKGSIWLINPETEEWMLELQKDGHLWYHDKIFDIFSKYLNMEESDFESFIGLWVEDALKRGVVSTAWTIMLRTNRVEDALKNGKQMK